VPLFAVLILQLHIIIVQNKRNPEQQKYVRYLRDMENLGSHARLGRRVGLIEAALTRPRSNRDLSNVSSSRYQNDSLWSCRNSVSLQLPTETVSSLPYEVNLLLQAYGEMHFQLEDLEAHLKILKQIVATRQRVISEYGKVFDRYMASFQSYPGKLRRSMVYTNSRWTREDKLVDIPTCGCSTLRELWRRMEALQSANWS
jgi:hypothetical protein